MSVEILGREAEQEQIGVFLDGAAAAAAALVLEGPAGSGKTTLLRAATDLAASHGYTILRTAPARGDVRLAFAGLADLMERCIDQVADALPSPQARPLRVALLFEEALGVPPDQRLIAMAFRSAVSMLAATAPVLLAIDDVQWLDPSTEAVVSYAVRRLESEHVAVLCAHRTDRAGGQLPLGLSRGRMPASALCVGGLSIGLLHHLLRTRIGRPFAKPDLRRIEAESGGNPFIALEIGRALARREEAGSYGMLPVPDTVSGLVAERLGELPPAAQLALQLVAVIPGLAVGRYQAAGVSGPGLDAAVQAGVLEAAAGRLSFTHPLLLSAVSAAIPPARLRELHGLAAQVADGVEDAARHHALAADGPSAAVADRLDTAAAAAASRGAPATAAELYELGASLTAPAAYADTGRRIAAAARHHALAGATRQAITLLQRSVAGARAGPERSDLIYLLGWLSQDDAATEATALLEQALAEAGDDPARVATIRLALSDNWAKRGDKAGQAYDESHLALAAAEQSGEPALIAAALGNVVQQVFQAGRGIDESKLERALALERNVGMSQLAHSYLPSWVAGYCHAAAGHLETAETAFQRVLTACDTEGLEYWRPDVLLRMSLLAGQRGELQLAASRAADGLVAAEQADLPQTIAALLYACGEAALALGQGDAVRDLSARGMAAATSAGDTPYYLRNAALPGALDLAAGDYSAAAAVLGPLALQYRKMGNRMLATTGIEPQAVEALAAVGDLAQADDLVAQMARYASGPLAMAVVTRCRSDVALARGDVNDAAAGLTETLRLLGEVSLQPLARGRTLLALGRVQRRLKKRAAARVSLEAAGRLFDQIGAPLWAARTHVELARISGRAPGAAELTATELTVTELVSAASAIGRPRPGCSLPSGPSSQY